MKNILTRLFILSIYFLLIPLNVFSQAPVADFTSSSSNGCSPLQVSFTDMSTGNPTSYLWDFGDPNAPGTSALQNPSHLYQIPGTYTVTLTAFNASGSNSVSKTGFVTVYQGPTADYMASEDSICSGQSITFSDISIPGDGAINLYQWSFNDGSAQAFNNPVTHTYNNSTSQTTFFVPVFTVTDVNGCISTFSNDTISVFVVPSALIAIVSTSSTSLPLTVGFSAITNGIHVYHWNFGDPTSGTNDSSSISMPSHLYANAGTYTVFLTTGFPGCESHDSITFDANTLLNINPVSQEHDLSLYPNPVSNLITVSRIQPFISPITFKIYDSNGLLIKSGKITTATNNFNIDVSDLKNGNYIFEALINDITTRKVFVHN